jgi:hypothetical protein
MIAAAALAAVAGSAAAQTYKAEIPFAVRVGNKVMQPGAYIISTHKNDASAAFTLYNADTKMYQGLVATRNGHVSKAWQAGVPVLVFECVSGECGLRELWDGTGGSAFQFPRSRRSVGEARIAMVALTPVKAD